MEQRLIDANPIYDKVEANYRMSEGVQHECEREFLNLICDAPTVDAVPVTRCAQCKWWWKVNGLCTHPKHCHDNVCVHECDMDYFCADGEPKQ